MPEDRSKDRHSFRASFVVDKRDWRELGELVGEDERSEVMRQVVKALLGRPRVRMPRRRDYTGGETTTNRTDG